MDLQHNLSLCSDDGLNVLNDRYEVHLCTYLVQCSLLCWLSLLYHYHYRPECEKNIDWQTMYQNTNCNYMMTYTIIILCSWVWPMYVLFSSQWVLACSKHDTTNVLFLWLVMMCVVTAFYCIIYYNYKTGLYKKQVSEVLQLVTISQYLTHLSSE